MNEPAYYPIDNIDEFMDTIGKLKPIDQKIFQLLSMGFSHSEIGLRCGKKKNTITKRIVRARTRLRRFIDEGEK
jgi:DNA-directed RNA polymerase specialized sigma24 family protein